MVCHDSRTTEVLYAETYEVKRTTFVYLDKKEDPWVGLVTRKRKQDVTVEDIRNALRQAYASLTIAREEGLLDYHVKRPNDKTENSIESTVYELQANEDYANGVPIGMAIDHSGAYVVDQQLRIVAKGILGELVLTGDGLARGYTDPAQDEGRFIRLTVGSRVVRAYRTGDAARARPGDGMLECFGRLDRQIKIRGHRIELPEVELTMLDHT
ncbi:hypothetical protein AC578_5402 [Pseudocercospora eumusae]|uniref:Uncharacterized protein n=1 Tax=Pseudocercospora eumusae TaxID=321146 RepID=A0A139HK53_9PEZI|nr:hypothetical protein AC578_5402 [Pseudocercospora eumusae]